MSYASLIGGLIGGGLDFAVIVLIGCAIAFPIFGKRNPIRLRPFVFMLLICMAAFVVTSLIFNGRFDVSNVLLLLIVPTIAFFIIRRSITKKSKSLIQREAKQLKTSEDGTGGHQSK